jgi:hypothetical protein
VVEDRWLIYGKVEATDVRFGSYADIDECIRQGNGDVRFVPKADIQTTVRYD